MDQFDIDVRAAKRRELSLVNGLVGGRPDLRNVAELTDYLVYTLEQFSGAVEDEDDVVAAEEAEWFAVLGAFLSAALSGQTNLEAIKRHETEVLISKHHDYGPTNIANSPGGPLNGLRVRLHDKLARLRHLTDQEADPEHESLVDTALDIANYGTIAGMVLRGEWPEA